MTRPDLEKALAHPTRLRILAVVGASEGAVSPRAMATALDLDLGVVAYHVRVLARARLLRLAKTDYVRGAIRHHYLVTAAARSERTAGVLVALEEGCAAARAALFTSGVVA